MSGDTLTCRCRHCGKTFSYLRSDAGAQMDCPECAHSVLLPGRLRSLATKQKRRVTSIPGLILEIGGFLLMLWYPFGTVAGPVLVAIGWNGSVSLRCSNCDQPASREAAQCAGCRAAFSSD